MGKQPNVVVLHCDVITPEDVSVSACVFIQKVLSIYKHKAILKMEVCVLTSITIANAQKSLIYVLGFLISLCWDPRTDPNLLL